MDASGGVTRDVNKHISRIIKPYAGNNEYTVKNSKHFVTMIKDVTVSEDETLVSYDVKALYPSVPQKEAIDLISELLHQDNKLQERTSMKAESVILLLRICVENTYFTCLKLLFTQVDGLAIGASTSGFAIAKTLKQLLKQTIPITNVSEI